jgi:hypothetical protein
LPFSLLLKVIGVDLNIIPPLLRHIFIAVNRFNGTGGLTRAAIDAFIRIDIEMFERLEIPFILARVNAIYRANVDARGIFCADAWFTDNINSHYSFSFLDSDRDFSDESMIFSQLDG